VTIAQAEQPLRQRAAKHVIDERARVIRAMFSVCS